MTMQISSNKTIEELERLQVKTRIRIRESPR